MNNPDAWASSKRSLRPAPLNHGISKSVERKSIPFLHKEFSDKYSRKNDVSMLASLSMDEQVPSKLLINRALSVIASESLTMNLSKTISNDFYSDKGIQYNLVNDEYEAGKIVPLVFSDNDLKISGLYRNEVKQFKSLNESKDSGREFPELEGLSEDEVFKLLSSGYKVDKPGCS